MCFSDNVLENIGLCAGLRRQRAARAVKEKEILKFLKADNEVANYTKAEFLVIMRVLLL